VKEETLDYASSRVVVNRWSRLHTISTLEFRSLLTGMERLTTSFSLNLYFWRTIIPRREMGGRRA